MFVCVRMYEKRSKDTLVCSNIKKLKNHQEKKTRRTSEVEVRGASPRRHVYLQDKSSQLCQMLLNGQER